MEEEARTTDYRRLADGGERGCNGVVDVDDDYKDRVSEWEDGLPDCGDLTPLGQALVPLELASAFSITPEPSRTVGDVALASRSTLSSLRGGMGARASSQSFSTTNNHELRALDGVEYGRDEEEEEEEEEEEDMIVDRLDDNGGNVKQARKSDSAEEVESAMDGSKAAKRQRLVWTPQLHKRFVDVVSHLGIKNAVPKTIMQMMNVEGLTRENVASHLQKYRLYLKRMQSGGGCIVGNSDNNCGGRTGVATSSATDRLFASTPVPPRGMNNENSGGVGVGGSSGHAAHAHRNGALGTVHMPMPMMMGYGVPGGMAGIPVYGMYGEGHPGMPIDGNQHRYGPHPPQSGASSGK